MSEDRVKTSANVGWVPRPGWATVRLVGTCADRSLRRGQVVLHMRPARSTRSRVRTMDSRRARWSSSWLKQLVWSRTTSHLIPESAVVAVGEQLP